MDGGDSRSSLPGDEGKQSSATAAQPASSSDLREDQIQNAVSFLSHPKVRGSPKASKVSFLQNKGLTEAEIDEAFRRVPETPVPAIPTTSSALTTVTNHVAPQQQYPTHTGAQPLAMQQQQHPQEQPIRWSQVALGAGFAAASVYAVKSLVWPFVSDKYTAWRGTATTSDNRIDVAASASTVNVNAVADAIRGQTAELASSIETLKSLIAGLDTQRAASPEDKLTAAEIKQELHTIAASLNEIVASPRLATTAAPSSLTLETELSEIKNLLSEYLKTPRSGDHTPPGELNRTTTPGSYSSAHEQPLSQAPSPVQLTRGTESSTTSGPGQPPQGTSTTTKNNNTDLTGATTSTTTATTEGRHPASYMEVLEMLERGETPPGIRDDINDKPPNPEQPPPPARMKPLPKPWEKSIEDNTNKSNTTPVVSHILGSEENGVGGGDGVTSASGVIDLSPVVPDDEGIQRPLSIFSPSPSPSGTATSTAVEQQQYSSIGGTSPSKDFRTAAAAGSKGASSIFEAATSSQGSPGVIAGRLSPSSEQRRSGGGGVGGRGVVTPTALFPDTNSNATTTATLVNGDGVGPSRPPRLTTTTPLFPDEGGLGRPTSRGWRPPPIPVPTLSPESSSHEGGASGSGMKNSASQGSQNSLGADFAAA